MPASDRHALVMKSTVPVGTGERIKRGFARAGKEGFRYVSCPEFLKEGSAVKDFLEPDRVVVGDEGDWAGDAVVELYAPLEAPLVRTDIRAPRWSSSPPTRSWRRRSRSSTRSPTSARRPAPTSPRSPRAWASTSASARSSCRPGIGFGGSCFPKDVTALKQLAGNSGYHFQLLNAVIEVNELQKRRVIAKLQKHLGALVGKRIALLGLAFKPNTDDMREASLARARRRGCWPTGASVRGLRPGGRGRGAQADPRRRASPTRRSDAVDGADAVVLVTEWPEFAELDLARSPRAMRGDLLVDGRNFLDPARVRAAGLVYEGIGRPAARATRGG